MPNWCQNRCVFSGPPAELARLRDVMQSKEDVFDFAKVMPMPAALRDMHTGSKQIDGIDYTAWRTEGEGDDAKSIGLSTDDLMALQEEYGASDWHEWANQHWGTKWGACDSFVMDDGEQLTYDFDTAWGPAEPFLNILCSQFPTLSLLYMYAEPGASFGGTIRYQNGEQVEFESAAGESIRGLSAWHEDQMGDDGEEDYDDGEDLDEDEEDDNADEEA